MQLFSNYPTEVFILAFLSITFVLSAIEKLTDWQGTIAYIKIQFKNSPLKKQVPILVAIVLITEIAASILMFVGIYNLYTSEIKEIASLGIALSALSLLFLLIGQRLAKDYPGAMSLGVYYLICLFGLFLLNK